MKTEKTNNFSTFCSIVSVILGTGTLALPHAIKSAGWLSIIFIPLAAGMSIYTSQLLIECLYDGEKRLRGYGDIGYLTFGKAGKIVIDIMNFCILLAVVTIFIMLSSLNIIDILSYYDLEFMPRFLYSYLVAIPILIPYLMTKSIKETTLYSILGLICTLVVIFVAVISGFLDHFEDNGLKYEYGLVNWWNLPSSLAIIGFSFGGNAVYPQVEKSMRDPTKWRKVTIISMTSIAVVYVFICGLGYFSYAQYTVSPIYNNLSNVYLRFFSIFFMTLHVLLTAPIMLCSFSLEAEARWNIDQKTMKRTIFRIATIIILSTLASFLPYFDDLLKLISSSFSAFTIFIIPVVCNLKLFGWRSKSIWELIFMFLILVIASFSCVLGSYDAIKGLMAHISEDS